MQHASVLEDVGEYRSACGYCDSGDTSVSHGASAKRLTVHTYQDLIDHGWRRSGTWLYKPNLKETCCKQYTIRLDVLKYRARRSQKKALNRWNSFLQGKRLLPGEDDDAMEMETTSAVRPVANGSSEPAATHSLATQPGADVAATLNSLLHTCITQSMIPQAKYPAATVQAPSAKQRKNLPEHVCFTTAMAFAVAAMAGKASGAKLKAHDVADMLVERFNTWSRANNGAYTAVNSAGHINFSAATAACTNEQTPAVVSRLPAGSTGSTQDRVHVAPGQAVKSSRTSPRPPAAKRSKFPKEVASNAAMSIDGNPSGTAAEPQRSSKHKFKLVTVPSQYIKEEFELYKLYQTRVHNDEEWEITPAKYKNFLVDSPLKHVPKSEDPSAPDCGYGSFHQQYWLDDVLISVGIVDVLPRCLSSVYFMWHPDYADLSLGRLSALKEIEWVQEAYKAGCANLHYYYMGFYIHSCPKMRYKADYAPSDLLCPEARVWVSMTDTVHAALDTHPYVVFSQLPDAIVEPNLAGKWSPMLNEEGEPRPEQQQVENLQISTPYWAGKRMPWKELRNLIRPNHLQAIERQLRGFCFSAGPASAQITYLLS